MTTAEAQRPALERYLDALPREARNGNTIWIARDGQVAGRFMHSNLSSVFQPVRWLRDNAPEGHEAFIRSFDASGGDLSPWNLFANAATDESLIGLDRLCRTLHVLNYFDFSRRDDTLFLNVHDRLMLAVGEDHGTAFGRVLSALQIERHRIVIESPEAMFSDPSLLAYVLLNYRYNGYRICVNLPQGDRLRDLIRNVRPDYVKLDAGRDDTLRDIARHSDFCARHGIRLIVKRIGTTAALESLREAGVALGQGHAIAPPAPFR